MYKRQGEDNMRKLQCIIVAICLCFALTSCSRGIVGKAVEQSKLSMANKDYEAALNYLELAKSEGRDVYKRQR